MPNSSKKNTYASFGGHGVDVALVRADDLDKLSLEYFSQKNTPPGSQISVLDLGCGAGGHSVRMARVGLAVTAVDKHDFSKEFKILQEGLEKAQSLEFVCGDANNLLELLPNRSFDNAYMQRTLHYLKREDALSLLTNLHQIINDALFVSVMGIKSDAGKGYSGSDVDVDERFFRLSPESVGKYSIEEPVCLYDEAEFIGLLEEAGWKVEKCWSSAFWKHKGFLSPLKQSVDIIMDMNLLNEQKAKVEAEIKKLEGMGGAVTGKLSNIRDSAFARFPMVFVLLSSFGLVSTFYGFEKIIDEIPYFAENPQMILIMGVTVLVGTGALYKKLN